MGYTTGTSAQVTDPRREWPQHLQYNKRHWWHHSSVCKNCCCKRQALMICDVFGQNLESLLVFI